MPQSSAELAKRYGGVSVSDLAKQYGGVAVSSPLSAEPSAQPPATAPSGATGGYGALATIGDFVTGLGQSAMGVVKGGGELLRMIPGVNTASEVIGEAHLPASVVTPQNMTQGVGKFAGDTAQFFLPTGVVGKGAKLAEIAKAGGLTALQTGGDPLATGASAAITAVIPGAGATKKLASALDESATKSVLRALGPTKENMKATARSIAPEMIERGVKGSREDMLATAKAMTRKVGAEKGGEVARMAEAGAIVPTDEVRRALMDAARPLTTLNAAGTPVVIRGGETVIKELEKLDDFIKAMGSEIPFDKADKMKQAWQRIVAKSGLYGAKVGANSTDSAKAWVFREGASAMKKALDEGGSDAYTALNKEYQFWRGMRDVLTETQRRTSGQAGTGLVASGAGVTGAGVGYMTGEGGLDSVLKGAAYGLAGRQIVKLLQSPQFATRVSAPLKKRLADALASGGTATIHAAIRSVLASLPVQVRKSLENE